MVKRTLVSLIVLAALSLPDLARACSCAVPTPCDSLWTAELVFIGHARTVVKKPGGVQEAQLVVEEWLRGLRVGNEIAVFSKGVGGSCDYGFQQGTRYLVYARRRPEGAWGVSLCSGTGPVDRATADLAAIKDALKHPGEGTLSGHAFTDLDPGPGLKSGPPISNMRLLLRSSSRDLATRTDNDGNYRFAAVPAGEYTLVVEPPPDHHPVPPKRIELGKGACARHYFSATKR
jgi:hypothetical protein